MKGKLLAYVRHAIVIKDGEEVTTNCGPILDAIEGLTEIDVTGEDDLQDLDMPLGPPGLSLFEGEIIDDELVLKLAGEWRRLTSEESERLRLGENPFEEGMNDPSRIPGSS